MRRLYLDTNVFYKHGFFRSDAEKARFAACHLAGFEVILPQTVIDEAKGNYERQLRNAYASAKSSAITLGKLTTFDSDIDLNVDEAVAAYCEDLDRTVKDAGITILPYPDYSTQDLVKAAYKSHKPFDKDGNGHKDYLIWEAIKVDMLSFPQSSSFVFVSENTNDFGVKKGQKDKDGCFQLHSDLKNQIDDVAAKLTCYTLFKDMVDQLVLPKLEGLRVEDVGNFVALTNDFVEYMLSKNLEFREMYGLDGLAFSNDVTVTGYGDASNLSINIYKVEDDLMVKITGSCECMFEGFIDKAEYYSEYDMSDMSVSQWNDHVFAVEDEAMVEFEILAIYDPEGEDFDGQSFEVLNEIEPDWHQ